MPNDDERPQWQHRIDGALSRAVNRATPFSVEDVANDAGVWFPRQEALAYTRRKLAAIGGANQSFVIGADKLRPWEDFAVEERIDSVLDVIFSDPDDEEAKARALNARRTWRFLREAFQRMELRGLLLSEQRKFIREEQGDDR